LKKKRKKIKCSKLCFLKSNVYRYAKEVSHAIRYIALLCVTFSTGAVIFGYLTFMSVSSSVRTVLRVKVCSLKKKFCFMICYMIFSFIVYEKRIEFTKLSVSHLM